MIKITIEFVDEEQKNEFLGQVSDGAMENMCYITVMDGKLYHEAAEFFVEMLPRDEWV